MFNKLLYRYENLWIVFKGLGLLVSHKALEDWSANQGGETFRMHDDKDEDDEEGNRPLNWDKWPGRRGADIYWRVTGHGYLGVVFLSHGNLIGGKRDPTMV